MLLKTPFLEAALAETADRKTYDDEDRLAMNVAIREAFERMDAEHAAQLANSNLRIDTEGVREFFCAILLIATSCWLHILTEPGHAYGMARRFVGRFASVLLPAWHSPVAPTADTRAR